MSYFTQEQLAQIAAEQSHRRLDIELAFLLLEEIAVGLERLGREAEPHFPGGSWKAIFDIFLSYSSQDSVAVLGLYHWLTSRQYAVYLDCFDPLLNPKVVNRATATILRRRMIQSRSLFVATSQNSPSSQWVPWELGFTDGLTNKAAALYIAPQWNGKFGRQSYFELYPEVSQGPATANKGGDLIIDDPAAIPPLYCDWNAWLKMPRQY
jgi:hypothetical protein